MSIERTSHAAFVAAPMVCARGDSPSPTEGPSPPRAPRLLGQVLRSRVLPHWSDGAIARPADAEYCRTGCNLQLLYLIWRLEETFDR